MQAGCPMAQIANELKTSVGRFDADVQTEIAFCTAVLFNGVNAVKGGEFRNLACVENRGLR